MRYDLLIKNGRIVDGSGMPPFRGDVAVSGGKIVELGRLDGPAKRVIDAAGNVIAPGFIDNHCHYDAQVTWDPLCTYSCYHGATSVIIGNCSLTLAPVRPNDHETLAGMLSEVEAIPMDILREAVPWNWETFPEYMDAIGRRLAINVGTLVGHSAVRQFAMGEASQERAATEGELDVMRRVVREALEAGALGLSVSRNMSHLDVRGKLIPAAFAPETEMLALAQVLQEVGTGVMQSGGGAGPELKQGLMSRLSAASGRPVMYNSITHSLHAPGRWREHLKLVEERYKEGTRAVPLCTPNSASILFNMKNSQFFRQMPNWLAIMQVSDDEKLRMYNDPAIRKKLRADLELPENGFDKRWDILMVEEPALPQNRELGGKRLGEIAAMQGKEPLDAFLDLAVQEKLNTVFGFCHRNTDRSSVGEILNSPYTVVGLSDGGAHVQYHSEVGYSTRLLGYWVREQGVMSLEQAVRRLTFDSATAYGIYDRGLLRPGLAADVVVFDPNTVQPRRQDVVHDFPHNGWRMRVLADGIHYTVVNGEVVLDHEKPTGANPGKVLRNALYPHD
ncbi:MAG: amidohydrolase family protein [Candidatus Binatia bacterium]